MKRGILYLFILFASFLFILLGNERKRCIIGDPDQLSFFCRFFFSSKEKIAETNDHSFEESNLENCNNHIYSPKRVAITHSEARGIGYPVGYTTLEMLFAPCSNPGTLLPFFDLRGHYFNNNTLAGNIGLITRYIPEKASYLTGFNFYYDARNINHFFFNQIGVGFEFLSRWIDVRLNGYLPIGHQDRCHKKRFEYPGDFFAEVKNRKVALKGGNLEIGSTLLDKKGWILYAAGGGYYLDGRFGLNSWGAEGRFQVEYKDWIAVQISGNHDQIFGTSYQVALTLSLPLYNLSSLKNNQRPKHISNRQIYQPVQRHEIIPIKDWSTWRDNF